MQVLVLGYRVFFSETSYGSIEFLRNSETVPGEIIGNKKPP